MQKERDGLRPTYGIAPGSRHQAAGGARQGPLHAVYGLMWWLVRLGGEEPSLPRVLRDTSAGGRC